MVALVPVAWAGKEQLDRAGAPHVSTELQRALPADVFLDGLCLGSELPRRERTRLRRSAEVLIAQTRAQPGSIVTNTYVPANEPGVVRRDVTVRELAEEQLASLRSDGEHCAPDIERRLADAID